MNVNGAATAAARSTGTGYTPAPGIDVRAGGSAGSAPQSPEAIVDELLGPNSFLDRPVELPMFGANAVEIEGVQAAAAGAGLQLVVKNQEIDIRAEMKSVDLEVDTSLGDSIELKRDALNSALSSGTLDPLKWVMARRKLHAIEQLLEMIRAQEEKQRILRKLLKQLQMGVLTPSMIAMAKQYGLVNELKKAIREMVKSGCIGPQDASAMAGILAQAGIVMPELDNIVIKHERGVQAVRDASRAAKGLPPVAATAAAWAQTGVRLLAPGTSTVL